MTGLGDTHTDAEIEELCRLMLGLDRARLLAVLERLEDRGAFTEWQSATLADAMRLALARDPKFAHGMGERISKGVLSTAERDSVAWGRALAPAMGPAIRNAVRLMMQGLINSIENVVDQRLSWRSLRWRMEAWRTRRPFAEVVFRNTLLYRVEHVFLVHREGGVQLLHAAPADVSTREPDLIAAMLTAIQDFVRDAFEVPSGDTLTSFAVGDLRVVVESGSHAVLAAVVRGQPPTSLPLQLREALDAIESLLGQQLSHFDGDSAKFEDAGPYLETCLIRSERPGTPVKKKRTRWLPWALFGAAVLGLVWLLLGWVDAVAIERRFDAFLAEVRREPGIVVIAIEPSAAGWVVRGLRDPLSRPIDAIAAAHHLESRVQFAMQPYHALAPELVLRRVTAALAPPPEVAVVLDGEGLLLSGSAGHPWCEQAARIARAHPGIASVDVSDLRDTDEAAWAATAESLRRELPMGALLVEASEQRRWLVTKGEALAHLGRILDRPAVLRCTLWMPADDDVLAAERDGRALVERLGRELGLALAFAQAVAKPTLTERMLQFEVGGS